MPRYSRRDFLKLARDGFLTLSSALAIGGLLRFLDFDPNPAPRTEFELGPASDYPINSHTVLAQVPAALIHAETGFSALSLVCTHLGCTVGMNDQGFACPCHGSRFDGQGRVVRGPAKKPLRSLRVEVTETGSLRLFAAE